MELENVVSVVSLCQGHMSTRGILSIRIAVSARTVNFLTGDSPIAVDTDGDITIKERLFNGSKGLWELLTR